MFASDVGESKLISVNVGMGPSSIVLMSDGMSMSKSSGNGNVSVSKSLIGSNDILVIGVFVSVMLFVFCGGMALSILLICNVLFARLLRARKNIACISIGMSFDIVSALVSF